jgi:hypothetical protein
LKPLLDGKGTIDPERRVVHDDVDARQMCPFGPNTRSTAIGSGIVA